MARERHSFGAPMGELARLLGLPPRAVLNLIGAGVCKLDDGTVAGVTARRLYSRADALRLMAAERLRQALPLPVVRLVMRALETDLADALPGTLPTGRAGWVVAVFTGNSWDPYRCSLVADRLHELEAARLRGAQTTPAPDAPVRLVCLGHAMDPRHQSEWEAGRRPRIRCAEWDAASLTCYADAPEPAYLGLARGLHGLRAACVGDLVHVDAAAAVVLDLGQLVERVNRFFDRLAAAHGLPTGGAAPPTWDASTPLDGARQARDRELLRQARQSILEAEQGEVLFDVVESARRLGVAPLTVRRRIRAGTLPAIRLGRRWLVRQADLDAAAGRANLSPDTPALDAGEGASE